MSDVLLAEMCKFAGMLAYSMESEDTHSLFIPENKMRCKKKYQGMREIFYQNGAGLQVGFNKPDYGSCQLYIKRISPDETDSIKNINVKYNEEVR